MKLADTSVWIDFWRGRAQAAPLADLLDEGEVLMHPFVAGELALGGLGARRAAILRDLALLPPAPMVEHGEVFAFVDHHGLAGLGIGWVDVHLLASAKVAAVELWTGDERLARVWQRVSRARSG